MIFYDLKVVAIKKVKSMEKKMFFLFTQVQTLYTIHNLTNHEEMTSSKHFKILFKPKTNDFWTKFNVF